MLPQNKPSKKNIYLDHAAATPVHPAVQRAMEPFWSKQFGNPSSLHEQGKVAQDALQRSRRIIGEVIGARPEEVVFTAGGTESANLAVFGAAQAFGNRRKLHFVTSAIEHHAVLRSCAELERRGHAVTYLPVDGEGRVIMESLKKNIRPETAMVSIMYANNEIGTIQPIAEIGKWLSRENTERLRQGLPRILFHSDACQAAGSLDMQVNRLGVDLLTANGSKLYGPKQTGFLYVRTGVPMHPLVFGGGQERGLRSGTENVPGIVGLAESLRIAQRERKKENARLQKLSSYFIRTALKKIPGSVLNGPQCDAENMARLPNNIHLSFSGVDGEALVLYLNGYNIAASTGSACSTISQDPSHVLSAIGRTAEQVRGSVRFTLGLSTTKRQIDYVLKILPEIVFELKKITNEAYTGGVKGHP